MRQRGASWDLTVYLGHDPLTGKKRYATRTVRGGKRLGHGADAAPPPGHREVTPRIAVDDVVGQVDLLRSVFGAVGDVPSGRPAELRIGGSLVMVGSTIEREAFPAFLFMYVENVDRVDARALDAGAEPIEAPVDTPYGDRRATIRDPFGNLFQIARRLENAGG